MSQLKKWQSLDYETFRTLLYGCRMISHVIWNKFTANFREYDVPFIAFYRLKAHFHNSFSRVIIYRLHKRINVKIAYKIREENNGKIA